MSWNNEIITAQIAEIQSQKNGKINLQKEFNKAVFDARVTVLNQNSICMIKKEPPALLKVERLNSLKQIARLNTTIKNTFGVQAYDTISKLVTSVYTIKDVCALDGDNYDYQIQTLYNRVGNIMDLSIKKDADKINLLMKKRHKLEFTLKI